ncbi:ABC transporter permease [Actinocorallia populi]|uniref:ABC transporter permease n=1 Tax=Actinocorallia populi TaxID=2079200 RepID=UPI000D09548A|nr:ABC transporter permease [Actinocorallia populi]
MVAIHPLRVFAGRVSRPSLKLRFPIFVGRVLTFLLLDLVLRRKYFPQILRQVSDLSIGVGAVVVGSGMVFVMLFMSMATGAQVGLQGFPGLQRLGVESFTGLVVSFSSVREVSPVIAAIALVAQVGSAFTAEIGAMRISEEIDALDVMGINSLSHLVCTRIAAVLITLIPLYLIALYGTFFAAEFITTWFFGLSEGVYDYYFHLFLPTRDILYSVIKIAVFAVIVMLIHGYRGYFATGGPVGVGLATGRAIRESMVAIVMVNLALSFVFWGQGGTMRLTG